MKYSKTRQKLSDGSRQLTVKDVIAYVSWQTGISPEVMLSKCRKAETSAARDLAIHRARVMTRIGANSIPYIGRAFNRDASSISVALQRQDKRFKVEQPYSFWDALCVNYLRRNYATMSAPNIAYNIGRNPKSVNSKIYSLGLAKPRPKYVVGKPKPKQSIVQKYKNKPKQIIVSQEMNKSEFTNLATRTKLKSRYEQNMAACRRAKQLGQPTKADGYLRAAQLAAQELSKRTHGQVVL